MTDSRPPAAPRLFTTDEAVRALEDSPSSLPGPAAPAPLDPIIKAPAIILRKRARELTDRERAHDADRIIERLFVAMRENNGAGLAAPQINIALRVFVMGAESFVNPVITERSEETADYEEGCLSLPEVFVMVRRNVTITVQTAGRRVRLTGQAARVAQHEIDHLDGVLITDRGVGGIAPAPEPPTLEHRAANEASFKQSGLDWCAHQMAYNWPRNEFGSLITEGEVQALRGVEHDTFQRVPSGPWKAQPSNSTLPWRVWCPGRKVLSDLSREEALAVREILNRIARIEAGARIDGLLGSPPQTESSEP